ncbi:TPA: type II toxin-antitoxin system Phd/YefM family antitoxin [Enterobacter hormaechei subsp. xiangfangensis]|nr:type II toxin-antitoxin system Phd/YefM family antitoxin [Enterobacter hormaechei subsp. xiangfangensis]
MKTVTEQELHDHFDDILDEMDATGEHVLITRPDGKNLVMLPADEWRELKAAVERHQH